MVIDESAMQSSRTKGFGSEKPAANATACAAAGSMTTLRFDLVGSWRVA